MRSRIKPIVAMAIVSLALGHPLLSGCGAKKKVVQEGDRVQVYYRGTLEDGSVFDESPPEQPLEFVVGSGQLIRGFDHAVRGMKVGEEKRVTVPPDSAYGERDDEKIVYLSRSDLPPAYKPEEGMGIALTDREGTPVPGTIAEVGEDSIVVDINHPLAGQRLTFQIKIVAILGPAE
jgi:peptidylprolyl isomerase